MRRWTGASSAALLVLGAVDSARAQQQWQTLPTPPPLPNAERTGYAPVNGIRMWYAIYGKGDPILLIPIGMADANMWSSTISKLSARHMVVVADSRGHGRSTRTATPYSFTLLASDYLALLDSLKIDRVALVGASDGAIIGLEIAMHHPERLTKLFAQGANATPDGVNQDAADPTASKAASALWQADYRRLSPTPDQYEAFHKAMNQMWDSQPNYSAQQLAQIRVPTAIVIADHDEWIKPEHARYLARTIPGAHVIVLNDVSHYAALQAPDAYAASVLRFVDGQ